MNWILLTFTLWNNDLYAFMQGILETSYPGTSMDLVTGLACDMITIV